MNPVATDILLAEDNADDADLDQPPKLVLLDLKLPGGNGMKVLKPCQGDPRTRTIPVVIMTSSKEELDRVRSSDLGANSSPQKPVDFEPFRETVKVLGLCGMVINQRLAGNETQKSDGQEVR